MDPIKVLIADDEEEILDLMKKKITQEGYDVVTAHDGQEAWDKIKSESPDMLILDITMPKMSGLEVLKELRENNPLDKWIPVIIVSAAAELEDVQKGYSLEADHYITKPCSMDDIKKAIKLMLMLAAQRKNDDEV